MIYLVNVRQNAYDGLRKHETKLKDEFEAMKDYVKKQKHIYNTNKEVVLQRESDLKSMRQRVKNQKVIISKSY